MSSIDWSALDMRHLIWPLIHPYSTLWTCMWCPGIDWPALDMRQLIWPLFALIQPCGPYLMSRHQLISTDMRHSIWPLFTLIQPWFHPYSLLFNLVDPYLMSRHWLIRTGHETFNLALICPYSTLWTCMWCPGIDWPALDTSTSAQRMVTCGCSAIWHQYVLHERET